MAAIPVVLSYGMGVDSTAILLRWLEEPRTRGFALDDLTVLTAHLGDEWPDTKRLVEEHVLPRLRKHGIRYVQVARAGLYEADGITVLDDSRSPRKLFAEGGYRLSSELVEASTVPTFIGGSRKCTLKFKGWVLDQWLAKEFGDRRFSQVIGFNADERKRIERDGKFYTSEGAAKSKRVALPGRKSWFPLFTDWHWGRKAVEDYCQDIAGEPWSKSCCTFCPFQLGKKVEREGHALPAAVRERFLDFPAQRGAQRPGEERHPLVEAERHVLHPQRLGPLLEEGVKGPEAALRKWLASSPWSVYEVRRYLMSPGHGSRSIRRLGTTEAPREQLRGVLDLFAQDRRREVEEDEHGIARVWIERRQDHEPSKDRPTWESLLVLAPALGQDKEVRTFPQHWARIAHEKIPAAPAHSQVVDEGDEEQLELFAGFDP